MRITLALLALSFLGVCRADPESDARAALAIASAKDKAVDPFASVKANKVRTALCPCGEKCPCPTCKCKGYFKYTTKRVKKCDDKKCWFETVIERERVKEPTKKKAKPVSYLRMQPVQSC